MIVVDTNILAYYSLPGPRTREVDVLLRRRPRWAAPLLWRSEFRNVLAGEIRRKGMSVADAMRAMDRASKSLLGGEHAVDDEAVLDLLAQSQCSAYDCEFVALADALETVLVTEDKGLLKAFPKACRSLAVAIEGDLRRR